jgi:hypothetical protein
MTGITLKYVGWHTGESPDVFTIFGFVLLRSDHPFHIYKNLQIMRNNMDGPRKREKFTITDTEVAYWRKIHDLNVPRKETPRLIYFVRINKRKEANNG